MHIICRISAWEPKLQNIDNYVFIFRGQEFIRVGYYVSNEYTDPELQETPPGKID